MKIKVVMTRSNPIDPDVRLEKEAFTLSRYGYLVTLLGWDRFGKSKKIERKNGYCIRRIKLKAPFGKKSIFFLPIWWILEFLWLFINRWDIVHAADFDTYFPALLAAKIKRKKVIYDIFDHYGDEVKLPSPIRDLFLNIDCILMGLTDFIIVVDESRLSKIRNAKQTNVIIIQNTPIDRRNQLKSKNRKENKKFKIFFAGALMKDRDIFTMVNVAKELGDIEVEIAGWGDYVNEIKEVAAVNPNLKYLGIITYDQVIYKTMLSDLLFALYDPTIPNNRYASPNKLFEAMMCGKPIIVNEGTSMADIVRKENCGIIIPFGDYHALRDAILKLKNNPDLYKKLSENGRKAYEEKYNWGIMEKRLLKIYNALEHEIKNEKPRENVSR